MLTRIGYRYPGSNRRPPACEADVIATRPYLLCGSYKQQVPCRWLVPTEPAMMHDRYRYPGSNRRPSACEADVIATRPYLLSKA